MTLSNQAREAFVETALRRMREELGDQWIGAIRFEVAGDHFSDLPQTTWLDIRERSWARPSHDSGGHAFKFTGEGLIAAMKCTGELESAEHKARCVRLRSSCADLNKGRDLQGTLTDNYELSGKSGLSENWIYNAIDARFMAHEWPKHYMDVEARGRDIRIPGNFGTQRLWGIGGTA